MYTGCRVQRGIALLLEPEVPHTVNVFSSSPTTCGRIGANLVYPESSGSTSRFDYKVRLATKGFRLAIPAEPN